MPAPDPGTTNGTPVGVMHSSELMSVVMVVAMFLGLQSIDFSFGNEYWNAFRAACMAFQLAVSAVLGVACVRILRPSAAAKAAEDRRRLKLAVACGSEAEGVTEAWYDASEKGIGRVVSVAGAGVALICAYATYTSLPGQTLGPVSHVTVWLESRWHYLLDNFTRYEIWMMGFAGHLIAYWGCSLFFAAVEFTRPAALMPYKIQPNSPLSLRWFLKGAAVGLFNEAIIFFSMTGVFYVYDTISPTDEAHRTGYSRTLPSLLQYLLMLLVCIPFTDVLFWVPHRLLHTEIGYKYVHYMHHHIVNPSAIHCIYAHPIEFIFGNMPVAGAGPILQGAHVSFWLVWPFVATVATCIGHSGFQFPFLPNQSHDFHHSHIPGPEGPQNLGTVGILDAVFGTNTYYNNCTWQKLVEKMYPGPQYPVERVLAQRGLLPEQGGPSGDGAPSPAADPTPA